ncbi:Lateral organ boundaries domain containing protein [Parasponia andersonii]|uniref:Lateral organ boundaries domain containing protein n=1 Tax=Parasponia andersonii TaxID=3476 RepID=A0A2P5B3I6_PARAD|nr:Lateral organ boundaries domain containing protein [Parasponia andersonii]
MRLSCNGCRILRRGCGQRCSIRPCLEWIKSPQSQSNATLFLAKFYGRAGLINLINAGPFHLRPEIFKSLLHEACGRIVNPVCGSAGLVSSGSWHLCEAAVEAVLRGEPITPVSDELAASRVSGTVSSHGQLRACDIRHVAKGESSAGCDRLIRKVQSRRRFKRSGTKRKNKVDFESETEFRTQSTQLVLSGPPASHDSEGARRLSRGADSGEVDSGLIEPKPGDRVGLSGLDLKLSLGFVMWNSDEIDATCRVDIGS